jgi:hypothetical protein
MGSLSFYRVSNSAFVLQLSKTTIRRAKLKKGRRKKKLERDVNLHLFYGFFRGGRIRRHRLSPAASNSQKAQSFTKANFYKR